MGLTRVAVATLLSLIGASTLGCRSGIYLRNDRLQQLAPFQLDQSVKITTDEGEKVVVEASRRPELVLYGATGSVPHDGTTPGSSDFILRAPLERFRFEPSRVILLADGPSGEASLAGLRYRGPQGDFDVPLSAIEKGEIVLGRPHAEPWETRWGVGVSIAGPSRFLTPDVELRILRHVSLEAGALILGPTGTMWMGARLISPRVHRLAAFAGGFGGLILAGEGSKGAGTIASHGVRLGLELMLPSWADAIALEVDFFRQENSPPSNESTQGCRDGHRCTFGGASYVHFF